jgi:hypothetical protein
MRSVQFQSMAVGREKTGETLRITIGPQRFSLGLVTGLLVLLIVCGVGVGPAWEGLRHALQTGQSFGGYLLGLIAAGAIAAFLAYVVLLGLFGSQIVLVSRTDLEIQSRIFGLIRSQRSVPNSTVEKLRYEEWPIPRGGMQHGIRFECVGETVTFAFDATTSECSDILDQMLKMYRFSTPDPPVDEPSPAVVRW